MAGIMVDHSVYAQTITVVFCSIMTQISKPRTQEILIKTRMQILYYNRLTAYNKMLMMRLY